MTTQIVILTDADVDRWAATDPDAGFGALMTDQGPLPLKALDVQARLEGLLAETTLTQTFVNTHSQPLEATYIFPLPDRAAVTRFRLEVAGRVVEGVLKERAAARREYDQAIQAGHRAAITEEERPGVFTMRVGNLPAGETATVRLTMVGPMIYDAGEVTYRFPLVVAPRYMPGNPLPGRSVGDGIAVDTDAVPDASRISPTVLLPGYPNPVRLSMGVEVRPTELPVRDFKSNLHAVVSETLADGTLRVAVQPGERVNRDFILRYQVGDAAIKTALTLVPDANGGGEGTYVLTVVPPTSKQTLGKPRDVVFVLDRSGSMAGWKMIAARRALGRMIDTLTERDTFTVLAFDDSVEINGEGLQPATDRNRFRALEWLAKIDARGGTEMAQPLGQAVSTLTSTRDRVLVLLTDGQVGNEDQILQALAPHLKGIRVFTLGIDQAVNDAFLRRFAALGGGSCDVVESEDRLDAVMEKVQRRIGQPLLTGLHIEPTGIALEWDSQVPARLPDLFAGVPLTVMGRYRGAGDGAVQLQATDDAGRALTQTVVGRISRNAAVAPVWARGRLRDLEDRWVVGSESPTELEQKIVALSLKFGVLCRFTAFVAVDRSETVNEGGKQQRLIQPVELPEGWGVKQADTGVFMACLAAPMACAPMSPLSADAVDDLGESEFELAMEDSDYDDEYRSVVALEEGEDARARGGPPVTAGPPGIFRRMLNALLPQGGQRQERESLGEDLTPYRERTRAILAEFRADPDREHALGVMRVKLQALVDDLKSIGAAGFELAPLEQLLLILQPTAGQVGAQQLERIQQEHCRKVEEVLAAFAGVTVAST
jgi:Ca-activated chloride channel family protein